MTKYSFRKASEPRVVRWTVRANVPVDGGKVEEQTIDATYRLIAPADMAAATTSPGNLVGQNGDVLVLRQCLVSVEGAESLDDVFGDPVAVKALSAGYFEMLAGRLPKN